MILKNNKKIFLLLTIILTLTICLSVNVFAEDKYTDNLIPIMTSETTPTGTVSYSGYFNDRTLAYKAFDRSSSEWATPSGQKSGWISYEFPEPNIITKYTIKVSAASYTTAYPKTWTFEGWNGSEWITLDSQVNIIDWKDVPGAKKEFTFSNTKEYKKYRLNITENNGYGYTTIEDIEMMSLVSNTTEETITVDTLKSEVNLGSEFTTEITLHNAVNMCAEDFKVTYNPDLFEYVGYEEVTGLKVYKEVKSATPGTVRFIVASLGKTNAINGDKVMVKLKFKAKKAGKDKIDVVKGRIANNGTIEKDILDANCGDKEITIKSALDVNRTGEFTLLDLGIDAWYYGDPVASTDTSKYDADVVINIQVDSDDLLAIVAEMMNNTNYTPNN